MFCELALCLASQVNPARGPVERGLAWDVQTSAPSAPILGRELSSAFAATTLKGYVPGEDSLLADSSGSGGGRRNCPKSEFNCGDDEEKVQNFVSEWQQQLRASPSSKEEIIKHTKKSMKLMDEKLTPATEAALKKMKEPEIKELFAQFKGQEQALVQQILSGRAAGGGHPGQGHQGAAEALPDYRKYRWAESETENRDKSSDSSGNGR